MCCGTVGCTGCFAWVGAPSTLGTFLRAFRFGHVRQLDAVAARVLAGLSRQTPPLAGAEQLTCVDIDDTIKAAFGYGKQGAGYGYTRVKGLNALLATVSTRTAAPVIAATRLRKGSANSARGAARLVADVLAISRRCGAFGLVVVRADAVYYRRDVIAAVRRTAARFSVTARKDPAVVRAIAAIPDSAWTPIRYPQAVFDEQLQQWVSDAEVAEVAFTAFTSRTPSRAGARPADRGSGPRRQPRPRPRVAAKRTVPGLAPPRGVHRLAAAAARRPAMSAGRVPHPPTSSRSWVLGVRRLEVGR